MDLGTVAKIVIAGVGIFTAGKVLFDVFVGKKTNLREEYFFAKEFLDDTKKYNLHPYTLGKGYQAIAGTVTVKAHEIEYILSLKNPIQCLRDFILSKQLFERLDTEGDFDLTFKKKYSSKYSRNWRKATFLVFYFLFAFAAVSPMLFSKQLELETVDSFLKMLLTLPFFGFYSWLSLRALAKLVRAEYIFNNQEQHTTSILMSSYEKDAA